MASKNFTQLSGDSPPIVTHCCTDHEGEHSAGCTITVDAPRDELYKFWRDFENLSRFMVDIASVTKINRTRSHWVAKDGTGRTIEWESRITEDVQDELIAWQSTDDSSMYCYGRVEFRDAVNCFDTRITLALQYAPISPSRDAMTSTLFQQEFNVRARDDLHRFKRLMETKRVFTARSARSARF